MTNKDERYDHGQMDDNLDQLLKLGAPAPRMPENLKARIRIRLAEVGQKSEKKNFLLYRWAIASPLAAAAVALLLIFFWPGGTPGTISWADVQKQLEKIHTLSARSYKEITDTTGKHIVKRAKIYIKDPGFLRIEYYDPDADLDAKNPEAELVVIIRNAPGQSEYLTLHPGSHRAEAVTHIFHANGPEPVTRPIINLASENWKFIKQITADKTNHIGDRIINSVHAVGFGFETPTKDWDLYIPKDEPVGETHIKIWANDDAVPLLAEVEFWNTLGQHVFIEDSEIKWNVWIEESLFDLSVPNGWNIRKTMIESMEFSNTNIDPNTTLQIGPYGQEPIADAGDVADVVQAIQTTDDRDSEIHSISISINLKSDAAKRLRDYADAHPDNILVVNFNGQIKAAAVLDAIHPTQLNFDLTWLRLSLADFVAKYLTTSIERNK